MTTRQERQKAIEDAQRTCEREGTPNGFARAYRKLCFDRGIDPDEPPERAEPIVGCPRCKEFFPHNELLAADHAEAMSRIGRDLDDVRRMSPHGASANARQAREQRAADWAQDRCAREEAPQRFGQYYEDRLAAIS